MQRIGKQLRLMEFKDKIIRMDGGYAIAILFLALLVGIAIGRSYWLKCLLG